MANDEADDDVPTLNASALAALQDFYNDRDQRAKQLEDLKTNAENEFDNRELSMDAFTEDWNASQFWYTKSTATTLAEQLLDGATEKTKIAVVSAPSVYIEVRNLLSNVERYPQRPRLLLLEYDERFAVFKADFAFYDFKQPVKLDAALRGQFDRIICDPPFLSEECQTKAAMTVRWLSRPDVQVKTILCTGERMESLAHKLYSKSGLKTTTFLPEHSKGLSNEFRCYANFECSAWTYG